MRYIKYFLFLILLMINCKIMYCNTSWDLINEIRYSGSSGSSIYSGDLDNLFDNNYSTSIITYGNYTNTFKLKLKQKSIISSINIILKFYNSYSSEEFNGSVEIKSDNKILYTQEVQFNKNDFGNNNEDEDNNSADYYNLKIEFPFVSSNIEILLINKDKCQISISEIILSSILQNYSIVLRNGDIINSSFYISNLIINNRMNHQLLFDQANILAVNRNKDSTFKIILNNRSFFIGNISPDLTIYTKNNEYKISQVDALFFNPIEIPLNNKYINIKLNNGDNYKILYIKDIKLINSQFITKEMKYITNIIFDNKIEKINVVKSEYGFNYLIINRNKIIESYIIDEKTMIEVTFYSNKINIPITEISEIIFF